MNCLGFAVTVSTYYIVTKLPKAWWLSLLQFYFYQLSQPHRYTSCK